MIVELNERLWPQFSYFKGFLNSKATMIFKRRVFFRLNHSDLCNQSVIFKLLKLESYSETNENETGWNCIDCAVQRVGLLV